MISTETLNLLDSFPEPKILLDGQYRIVAANAAYRQEFGADRDVVGRYCYELSHHYDKPCDQAGENCPLRDCMESGHPNRVLHVHHTSAGREHVEVEVVPVRNEAGGMTYFMETMHFLRQTGGGARDRAMVGYSRPFNRMLELARRVAEHESSVLLLGESGTGKELFARAVHLSSQRRDQPFIKVNCAAIPDTLFESELFGYERGAFTGAQTARAGWFEQADRGTIFLDEIGEMPLAMQTKLLRTLQEGTIVRLGGKREIKVAVRVVAATNRDLAQDVLAGSFRRDLFYRLNVIPIRLPSLRERRQDIRALAVHFLSRINQANQRNVSLSAAALARLEQHPWPGNIRELGNVIERLVLLSDSAMVSAEELERFLPHEQDNRTPGQPAATQQAAVSVPVVRDYLAAQSHPAAQLQQALRDHGGNQSRAAQALGLTVRQFSYRLRKLGLHNVDNV